MNEGVSQVEWSEYHDDWTRVEAEVIDEALISIYVNGREITSMMCTPKDLKDLALGFLVNEGFFNSLEEVEICFVSKRGCCVDVWLTHEIDAPTRKIVTSGCGKGVTFSDPSSGVNPVKDDRSIEPDQLFEMFLSLQAPDSLYARARGVHGAGLFNGKKLICKAEDVGRHNTIDKVRGGSLRLGLPSSGWILLATGRITSEMLHKSALMGCSIVASRTSPSSLSIAMAEAWNITLIGYVRRDSLRVYTHPWRLGFDTQGESTT
jgi:FdhD protein